VISAFYYTGSKNKSQCYGCHGNIFNFDFWHFRLFGYDISAPRAQIHRKLGLGFIVRDFISDKFDKQQTRDDFSTQHLNQFSSLLTAPTTNRL
jgi:hypothetical protein